MNWFWLPVGFVCGSVPFGLLLGRWAGIDVREAGSGNIGATNVWRLCGWKVGLVALLLDIFKGYLPVSLCLHVVPGDQAAALHVMTAAAAVLGHTFSPWIKFRGGKGVATTLGVVTALLPLAAGTAFATFVLVVFVTRFVSLGSLLGALVLALMSHVGPHPALYHAVVWCLALLIWLRHRGNLARLLQGTEARFDPRGRRSAAEKPTGS